MGLEMFGEGRAKKNEFVQTRPGVREQAEALLSFLPQHLSE